MKRESYTAKQLAREMGITPRIFRKFIRTRISTDTPVGRGKRYEFSALEVPRIRSEFHAWRLKIENDNLHTKDQKHGPTV